MAGCMNKNDRGYQSLSRMAGIPSMVLDVYCQKYLDSFNRLPNLDELPLVDSSKHLNESLKTKQIGDSSFASNEAIQKTTGAESLGEAQVKLNNTYRDLQVNLVEVTDKSSLLEVQHRPSVFKELNQEYSGENFDVQSDTDKRIVLRNMLGKLKDFYGIKINEVTSKQLCEGDFANIIPDAKTAKAFIYNNEIYVNTDIADIDAPIHELMHIFLGGMRYTNPTIYFNLVSKAQKFKNLQSLSKIYQDRTQSDFLEEAFVSEFSKLCSGMHSEFDSWSAEDLNPLLYEVRRNMDSALMGNKSVNSIDPNELFKSSFLDIAMRTKSPELNRSDFSILNLAELHRQNANIKSKMLKDGDLVENCD